MINQISNEVSVKNEPINDSLSISQKIETTSSNNHPNRTQLNNKHIIKHERKSISINDNKRERESISSDDIPNNEESNNRKKQSIVAMKIKEEPIDSVMKKSIFHVESMSKEVEIKSEEKFSVTEEFINKTSIAFLNEETTTSTEDTRKTSNSQTIKTNKLEKSK